MDAVTVKSKGISSQIIRIDYIQLPSYVSRIMLRLKNGLY